MRKRLFAMLSAFVFLLSGIIACAEDEWEDWGEDDWGDEDSWGEDDWDDDDWGDDTDEADFDDEEEDKVKTGNAMMDSLSGYDDDFEVEGDFRYVFSEDRSSCTTKRYIGNEKDVLVPETLGGVPVTAIGDQTFQDCKIESVVLPETLISIDNMAFFKCEKLREVSVPEGVTNLGRCCFAGCITLQRISMPTTLETVDEFAF